MLPELDPRIEAGNSPEEVPPLETPLTIRQAEAFVAHPTHPISEWTTMAQSLTTPEIVGTAWAKLARKLLNDKALHVIQFVSAELKAATEARKAGDTKATKPADLYRKYAKALRQINDLSTVNGGLARALAADLYLEQTLSDGDLETPDYVDPYTGEKELTFEQFRDSLPEVHEPGLAELLKFIDRCPDPDGDPVQGLATPVAVNSWNHELNNMAQRLKAELGWTNEQAGQFINANRQFVGGDDEEEPFDDRGFVPSTLEDRELRLDRSLFFSAQPAIKAFNARRTLIFHRLKLDGVRGKGEWHAAFWRSMRSRHEFTDLIREIERVSHEDVITGACVYLSIESDDTGYGIMRRDVEHVMGAWVGGSFVKMVGYAEEWEDSLLDLVHDAGVTAKHLFGEEDIRKYAEFSEKIQAQSMPSVDPDPTKTRWYNMAHQDAIGSGATLEEADNAGWDAWRFAMDQKAAAAYKNVLKETGNRSSAMRAFWQACPRIIPRPVEHIKAIQGAMTGLVLQNDRRIDWHVAALKLKNGELEISGKIRESLKEKLATAPKAKEFSALL